MQVNTPPKPEKVTIRYFPLAGVAERVRLACELGKVPYEDELVSCDQWKELKPKTKFGQLPELEVEGQVYAQSVAMLNYVGKLAGLVPRQPLEALRADEVVGLCEDVSRTIRPSIMVGRDSSLSARQRTKKQGEMRKTLREQDLPRMLGYFESLLAKEGTGFFVGSSPTIADLSVLQSVRHLSSGILDGITTTILNAFPLLKAHKERMEELPEVHAYYQAKKQQATR